MITIFCLVHGEPITNAFPVDIDENKAIGHLKKLIKSEKSPEFDNVAADKLKLWSVKISIDDTSALENLVLGNNEEKGVQELLPTDDIADFFSTPLKKHIHVIVERPSDSNEVQRLRNENAALLKELEKSAWSNSSSLFKRKTMETQEGARKRALKALGGLPSPSEFAKPYGKGSCVYNNDVPLNHHRGASHSDVPVQFYHEIFQTFLTRLDKKQDDEEIERYQELVAQFVPPISVLMDREIDRSDSFLCFLRFLGLHLEPVSHGQGRMLSDGTLYTSGPRRFLLCNVEVKSDFPGGCCAYMQNVGYYSKFIKGLSEENFDVETRTCFPAFLVLLEGTYLSICGAVFGDSVCVDRLMTTIPLERAAYDKATLTYTARALHALVTCIKELDQHYTDVLGFVTIPKSVSNGMFPRILGRIDLQYNARLFEGKKLWLATMSDKDIERTVVVKFTCRYADEVHRVCAEKGIAPALRYSQQLGYGWIMVVMDYLDGYRSLFKLQEKLQLTEDLRASIHARLTILHDAGFVHGDMRSPNILLGPDGDVKLVDFDWAGKIGSTRYPTSMNPNIRWHPDVGLSKPVETTHDTYLVDDVFDAFKQPISPVKRQRFCEWDSKYGK